MDENSLPPSVDGYSRESGSGFFSDLDRIHRIPEMGDGDYFPLSDSHILVSLRNHDPAFLLVILHSCPSDKRSLVRLSVYLKIGKRFRHNVCLLYTSDAADE